MPLVDSSLYLIKFNELTSLLPARKKGVLPFGIQTLYLGEGSGLGSAIRVSF